MTEQNEIIAEALAYHALEEALADFIKDPKAPDDEIQLADGFLCIMRESKKKFLKMILEREAKK